MDTHGWDPGRPGQPSFSLSQFAVHEARNDNTDTQPSSRPMPSKNHMETGTPCCQPRSQWRGNSKGMETKNDISTLSLLLGMRRSGDTEPGENTAYKRQSEAL